MLFMFQEIYQGKHKMYYIKNVDIISSESSRYVSSRISGQYWLNICR